MRVQIDYAAATKVTRMCVYLSRARPFSFSFICMLSREFSLSKFPEVREMIHRKNSYGSKEALRGIEDYQGCPLLGPAYADKRTDDAKGTDPITSE